MSESNDVNCCAAGCKLWRDNFVTVAYIKLNSFVLCANLTFLNTSNYAFAETNGGF